MFNLIVDLVAIICLPFLVLTWWYVRADYYDRRSPSYASSAVARAAPGSRFQFPAKWRFPALGALGLILLISNWALIAMATGWVANPSLPAIPETFSKNYVMKQASQQVFKDQTVHLDGYDFTDCTFDNVTFIFEGTAPFRIEGAHFAPHSKFSFGSNNPIIKNAWAFSLAVMQTAGFPKGEEPLPGESH